MNLNEATCNTNTLGEDTIYLIIVYTHPKKKNLIPPLYSYLYANVIFNASLKGPILLILRDHGSVWIELIVAETKNTVAK